MAHVRPRVAILDKVEAVLRGLAALLRGDYRVLAAGDGVATHRILESTQVDLVVLSFSSRPWTASRCLKFARAIHPHLRVIVVIAAAVLRPRRRQSNFAPLNMS